jgi:hypothetical protein
MPYQFTKKQSFKEDESRVGSIKSMGAGHGGKGSKPYQI